MTLIAGMDVFKFSVGVMWFNLSIRIAVAPSFSGLRHFHEGRNFKQWTGDDSKALMKVFVHFMCFVLH